jgi:uracil-DNA glycosylase family 4
MVKESMLCRNCRYKDCVVVPNYKVEGAEILIVGEAPGEKEEYHGIPFVGPAGSLLRQTLKGAGFDMKKVALCNAVMCRPPKNETPKRQEIEMCSRQFLFKDILEMAPKRIVCVGAVASSVFEGDTWQGIPVEKIMHPAAVLYSPNKEGKFKSEVKKIYNVMHPGEMKKELFVVNDDAGLKEVGTWLEKNAEDIVACDIETTSLDPFDQNAQLLCVAFGYRSKAYSISLDGKDQVFVEKASRLIKERLMDKKTTYIFHRCWFDVKFLESRGFRVASYTDTRLMAFLINENRMEYGLKDLVAEYIGKYEYTLEEKDRHKFGEYNAEDAFFTYKLYQILQKQMTPEIENVLNKIILPCIPALNEMMLTGIKIDQKYAGKLKKDTLARREEAFKELTTKFKVFRGINLGSNPQMQTVLFQVLKEEPIKKTKTGFSVNEETLNTYAYKGKEWAKMILAVRKQEKLLSTYVEKIPKMVNYDGRIRTQFDPTGTQTGRLSSKKPNLQNIPRDSKIYRMFVADDGKGFLYFDFAAIELRIACSIAKEPRMIEAFRDGIDLHKRTAAMITGKETEAITKNERQLAKGVSFGLLYGQGADGLKRYLFDKFDIDIPMEEAERIRGVFFKNYNALPAWYARVREEVWKTHQIKYPTGRVRRFPQVKMLGKVPGEIFRQAVNAPVQGCLGGDTRVFVKGEGYKKIADYIGKEVEVWDGKNFVKGMAVASGSKRKVMIELFNGQRIVCSPDHKFLTINTRGIRCWKRPEEFSKSKYSREKICLGNAVPDFGGKVLIQNESINKTKEFPNGNNRSKLLSFRMIKDDFTLGVVLGRLVSDGTIGLKRNVAWLVAEHEYEIREYMKKALSVFGKVRVRIHDRSKEGKKEMTCFCVDSCFLARQADKMNLKNKMPEIVFNNKRILAGFLRGMFDGDGTVDKDNIRLTFGEGNKFEGYALDIQKALELFGIRSRVHRCSDRVNVVVRKIDCGKFARQIGFISSRKQKKADSLCSKQSNNIQGSVESVERVVFSDEYIDMYDIMDSKTHQFMADGFIVHNSANDCMEACIGNVHRLIKKRKLPAKFVLTVHDSCMLEIDEDGSAIDEVEDIIGMVLREVIPSNKLFQWLRVPLVAEFKRGKSWGDLA